MAFLFYLPVFLPSLPLSLIPSFLPSLTPTPLPPFYLLFIILFFLGARILWSLSNWNHSQWRSWKTRLSSILWISHLWSLCHRGKDKVQKISVSSSWTVFVFKKLKLSLKYTSFVFFIACFIHCSPRYYFTHITTFMYIFYIYLSI